MLPSCPLAGRRLDAPDSRWRVGNVSDCRIRRQLALGAVQLFLLTTASLLPAGVVRAQDTTEPAALTLEMNATVTTFSAVGDVITYIYRLTNTGLVPLEALIVHTELGDTACPSGPLEPDGSLLCMGSYSITQADLDAGSLTNSALASGTHGESGAEVASDEVSLTIAAVPTEPAALTLEMNAAATTFSAVGDVITYIYRLTNTGLVPLEALIVHTELGDTACPSGPLEPDGTLLCVGSYSITQADLDAGSVTNIAQGYGRYGESGAEVASDEASLTITALAPGPAALTLEMEAGVTTFSTLFEGIGSRDR